MDPIVIDADTQDFNGQRFWRFGTYFRRRMAFLHRAVWQHHNGPIPKGYHIHHVDGDGSNNALANLECMDGKQHISMHQKGHTRRPDAAIEALKLWRKTPEGVAHQRAIGLKNHHFMHVNKKFTCEQCGTDFETEDKGVNRFCSNACKSRWRRATGADNETRSCIVCDQPFQTNRFKKIQTCSRACGGKISGEKRSGVAQPKRK